MIFEPSHFQNAMLPGEILKCARILETLDGCLKEILFQEIGLGNGIFDVTNGWPGPNSILVTTRYPFKKKHRKKGITHRELKDPHYWKEEYSSHKPIHLLVCPFHAPRGESFSG